MQAANLQGIGGLRDLREACRRSKLALALKAYSKPAAKRTAKRFWKIWWSNGQPPTLIFGAEISISNQLTLTSSEGIGLTPAQAKPCRIKFYGERRAAANAGRNRAQAGNFANAFSGIRSSFVGVYNEATFGKVAAVADKQYATLMKSMQKACCFQTRLQPYLNAVTFTLANGGTRT